MKLVERFTISIDDVLESDYLSLKTELTKAEQASPYAKYYNLGTAEIPRELQDALCPGHTMDPSLAFMPEDMASHMLAPAVDIHMGGYCVLPNGIAFGATWCDMSAVTQEMEDYFDENWNPPGDLFYKIWYPGAHVRHYSNAAIESLGREPEILRVSPAPSLEIMGFPKQVTDIDPDFIGVRGGNSKLMKIYDRGGKDALDITLLHFYRRAGNGKHICTRFWMGLYIDRNTGKTVRTLPFYASVQEEIARKLCIHCATEYATNARNIVHFWRERNT